MQHILTCAAAWVLAAATAACAGEVSPPQRVNFSAKPTAAKDGDKVKIAFTVSAPTDVEVAVLGADGKAVRSLAAGVLGAKNPPPEPLKAGLAQTLEWDGKDDAGKAAAGGPFQVRVRAGTSVAFGRTIGASPYTGNVTDMPYRAPVNGLVVDKDGSLLVKMMSDIHSHGNSGLWPWHVRRFDKSGKYVKTLLALPAVHRAGQGLGVQAARYRRRGLHARQPEQPLRRALRLRR